MWFKSKRLVVLRVGEMHLLGLWVWEEGNEQEDKGWEELGNGYKGKDKEGIVLLLALKAWESIVRYGCVDSRIFWVDCKILEDKYVVVFVYENAPVSIET